MTNHVVRFIALIAVASLVAALLTYSRAMAENPVDLQEEVNMCTPDTPDTGSFEESTVYSAVSPAEDEQGLGCTYASCRSTPCPTNHPAAPFACVSGCCVPL